MSVGLRCQLQNHFAGINIGVDFRHATRHTLLKHHTIELAELFDFSLGIPGNAFAAVADLV